MNPLDDPDGVFRVLVNRVGDHSLWPAAVDVPHGWTAVVEDSRESCLRYIDEHWRSSSLGRARSIAHSR